MKVPLDYVADETPRLRDLIAELKARRLWLAAGMLAGATLGAILAFATTPVYRSATVVSPVSYERGLGGLSSALGGMGGIAALSGFGFGGRDAYTEEALAVLRSREFVERFIVERGLIPVLFESKWDAAARRWRVTGDEIPTPARAFKLFSRRIMSVSRDKQTGLVTVGIDWRDPDVAARWATELVATLNDEMRARAIADADAFRAYLEKERQSTELLETREAINRLIESQIRERMLATVSRDYAFRVVDRALPADESDPIRPRKTMLLIGGPVGGFLLVLFVVIWLRVLASPAKP